MPTPHGVGVARSRGDDRDEGLPVTKSVPARAATPPWTVRANHWSVLHVLAPVVLPASPPRTGRRPSEEARAPPARRRGTGAARPARGAGVPGPRLARPAHADADPPHRPADR